MPNIIIETGKLSTENKNTLIKSVTETTAEITQIPQSSFTVLIKEFPVENWGIGGIPLTEIMSKTK